MVTKAEITLHFGKVKRRSTDEDILFEFVSDAKRTAERFPKEISVRQKGRNTKVTIKFKGPEANGLEAVVKEARGVAQRVMVPGAVEITTWGPEPYEWGMNPRGD